MTTFFIQSENWIQFLGRPVISDGPDVTSIKYLGSLADLFNKIILKNKNNF